jgi:hypothetical protein
MMFEKNGTPAAMKSAQAKQKHSRHFSRRKYWAWHGPRLVGRGDEMGWARCTLQLGPA